MYKVTYHKPVRKLGAPTKGQDSYLPAVITVNDVVELRSKADAEVLIKEIRRAVRQMEKANANKEKAYWDSVGNEGL